MTATITPMKSRFGAFWEIAKILIIAFLIVVPIRAFLFQPFLVRGASMEPTFSSGTYLIIDEISYRFNAPVRGDIVVFRFPIDTSQRFIKRVIGLPGETVEIEDGKVVVYSEGADHQDAFVLEELYLSGGTPGNSKLELSEGEYYVMGDNRSFSSDSRSWGAVSKDNIIGKVFFKVFPL